MTVSPTVSVIIPVYNGAKTIEATVQSVLKQTLTDFELLVINDGSTDETLAVLAGLHDARLRVLSFDNAGVAESRNRGIASAKGYYISFLDADDLWTPNKLSRQIEALERHPEAAVVYSWTDYIDESGRFLRAGWHATAAGSVYGELVQRCFVENGSNVLFRAAVLEQVEAFDSSVVPTEDWDFYLRLAERFEFVCVPEVQILYRVSSTSQSANFLKMEKSGATVLRRTFARSAQRLRPYRAESWAEYYSYLFHRAWQGACDRKSCWIALQLFSRGLLASPKLLHRVAMRRVLWLCWGLVRGT